VGSLRRSAWGSSTPTSVEDPRCRPVRVEKVCQRVAFGFRADKLHQGGGIEVEHQ
jgi:hypothetical protein